MHINTIKDRQKKYANVLLKTGVNLYPGQNLFISSPVTNLEFAQILAEEAYHRGAKYVELEIKSNHTLRGRVIGSVDTHLDYAPEYLTTMFNQFVAEDWAVIYLENNSEADVLQEVDSNRIPRITKADRQRKKAFYNYVHNDQIAWCVAAVPDPQWAQQILGAPDTEKLWELLTPILQLDHKDPNAAWQHKGEVSQKRVDVLDSWNLASLHFQSAVTDLTIGLNPTSYWTGGLSRTPLGRTFQANIPTEEIFTTPDYRKTEGHVTTTRPLQVLNTEVKGAWFDFKEGRVIQSGADKNGDILEKYLSLDKGASFLGEVALVDGDSPISQTGKLFHSILFDENASCHIALGSGYTACFTNNQELNSDEACLKNGCNVSLVHTDFMIGSDDLSIIGTDTHGRSYQLMENGRFTSLLSDI